MDTRHRIPQNPRFTSAYRCTRDKVLLTVFVARLPTFAHCSKRLMDSTSDLSSEYYQG